MTRRYKMYHSTLLHLFLATPILLALFGLAPEATAGRIASIGGNNTLSFPNCQSYVNKWTTNPNDTYVSANFALPGTLDSATSSLAPYGAFNTMNHPKTDYCTFDMGTYLGGYASGTMSTGITLYHGGSMPWWQWYPYNDWEVYQWQGFPDGTYYVPFGVYDTSIGQIAYTGDYMQFSVSSGVVTGTGADGPIATQPFYAQISNMASDTPTLYSGPTTSTTTLKTLPQGWVVYVSTTTDAYGQPVIADGSQWYQVQDPTDAITGWMPGANASGTTEYLPYGADQSALATTSATTGASSSPESVLKAIDDYYNNSSSTNSLYSSDDYSGLWDTGSTHHNQISLLKERHFPEKVILAIAARENGELAGHGLNNEILSFDYGMGIMQLSDDAWGNEYYHSNAYSTFDNRGLGSGITTPLCASYYSSNYTNCIANAGGGDQANDKSYQPYVPDTSKTFKNYSNTPQSLYANVKDGMAVLSDKYFATTPGTTTSNEVCAHAPYDLTFAPPNIAATTTFTCVDREIIDVTAGYNGTSTPYLANVATKLSNIGDYFADQSSADASTTDLINKMTLASDSSFFMHLHSPGDISIQDSSGRAIGVVRGQARNDFPFASYDPQTKSAYIFFPKDDNMSFKVEGTASGPYGIDIVLSKNGKRITFSAANIVTKPGQIDTYVIDRTPVLNHLNGVTRTTDYDGDGTVDAVQNLAASVTELPAVTLKPLPEIQYIPIVLPSKSAIPADVINAPLSPEYRPDLEPNPGIWKTAVERDYKESLNKLQMQTPGQ